MQKVKIQCKGTFEYEKRCRLGPEGIRASVCLQAWNRVDSLDTIFEEDEDFFGETD